MGTDKPLFPWLSPPEPFSLSPWALFRPGYGCRPTPSSTMPGPVPCCPAWAPWASPQVPGRTLFLPLAQSGAWGAAPWSEVPAPCRGTPGSKPSSSCTLMSSQDETPAWITAHLTVDLNSERFMAWNACTQLILPASRVGPFGKVNPNFRNETCSSYSLKSWILTAYDKSVLFVKEGNDNNKTTSKPQTATGEVSNAEEGQGKVTTCRTD